MRALWPLILAGWLVACGPSAPQMAQKVELRPDDIQSGLAFLTPQTQALQADEFSNPGYLWVDRGAALFSSATGVSQPCAACHGKAGAGLKGVAATYPRFDGPSNQLMNLEAQIQACQVEHQDTEPFAYESDGLLSLTAFVTNLSKGEPVSVDITGPAATFFATGESYFFRRKGQLNLACSQCHTENWGRRLRGDTISQGHTNGFPTYRLVWQDLGSLHRRFRECDIGVRAEPLPAGSDTYLALELYLAARGQGLPVETPSVRR